MEVTAARKPATKVVTRKSNGEKVTLVLGGVQRERLRVLIRIPAYNAQFMFVPAPGFAQLAEELGRSPINPQEKTQLLHVSRTVYHEMAVWAWAILSDPRPEYPALELLEGVPWS